MQGQGTGQSPPRPECKCQVPSCTVSLTGLKDYHRRHRICVQHLKHPGIELGDVIQRFCQQCGRFHPLHHFEGDRRTCKVRLDRHNARRKLRQTPKNPAVQRQSVNFPSILPHQCLQPGQAPTSAQQAFPAPAPLLPLNQVAPAAAPRLAITPAAQQAPVDISIHLPHPPAAPSAPTTSAPVAPATLSTSPPPLLPTTSKPPSPHAHTFQKLPWPRHCHYSSEAPPGTTLPHNPQSSPPSLKRPWSPPAPVPTQTSPLKRLLPNLTTTQSPCDIPPFCTPTIHPTHTLCPPPTCPNPDLQSLLSSFQESEPNDPTPSLSPKFTSPSSHPDALFFDDPLPNSRPLSFAPTPDAILDLTLPPSSRDFSLGMPTFAPLPTFPAPQSPGSSYPHPQITTPALSHLDPLPEPHTDTHYPTHPSFSSDSPRFSPSPTPSTTTASHHLIHLDHPPPLLPSPSPAATTFLPAPPTSHAPAHRSHHLPTPPLPAAPLPDLQADLDIVSFELFGCPARLLRPSLLQRIEALVVHAFTHNFIIPQNSRTPHPPAQSPKAHFPILHQKPQLQASYRSPPAWGLPAAQAAQPAPRRSHPQPTRPPHFMDLPDADDMLLVGDYLAATAAPAPYPCTVDTGAAISLATDYLSAAAVVM